MKKNPIFLMKMIILSVEMLEFFGDAKVSGDADNNNVIKEEKMLTITQKTISDESIENLANKLHPSNFTAMSSKMAAIVAFVLGKEWTNPTINWMSVSSDGFVSSDSDFIGTEKDLKNNFSNLIKAAELTEEESIDFRILCQKIDNWY